MDPIKVLNRLNTIIPDCEYREPSKYNKDPSIAFYICGYNSRHEISINVSFGLLYTTFTIDHLGHNRMRSFVENPSEKDFECYYYILQDLLDSSDRIKKQVSSFPEFTREDNRNYKIDKLLENDNTTRHTSPL